MYRQSLGEFEIVAGGDGRLVRQSADGSDLGYPTLQEVFCDENGYLDIDQYLSNGPDLVEYCEWIQECRLPENDLLVYAECPDSWNTVSSSSDLLSAVEKLFSMYGTMDDYRFAEWATLFEYRFNVNRKDFFDLMPSFVKPALEAIAYHVELAFFTIDFYGNYNPSVAIGVDECTEYYDGIPLDQLSDASIWWAAVHEVYDDYEQNCLVPWDKISSNIVRNLVNNNCSNLNEGAASILIRSIDSIEDEDERSEAIDRALEAWPGDSYLNAYAADVPYEDIFA